VSYDLDLRNNLLDETTWCLVSDDTLTLKLLWGLDSGLWGGLLGGGSGTLDGGDLNWGNLLDRCGDDLSRCGLDGGDDLLNWLLDLRHCDGV
jgi:hypothetical protein